MFLVERYPSKDPAPFASKLRAPYSMLAALLGPPSRDRPERCSTYWSVRSETDSTAGAFVRDDIGDAVKFDVKSFRAEASYDWHVGATSQGVGMTFCRWLSGQVIKGLSEVKTLSPDAKLALNKLLAEGVPMDDAMKRVALQKPTDTAKRFAWPIKG